MSTGLVIVAALVALLLLAVAFVVGFVVGAFLVAKELRSEPTEAAPGTRHVERR